MTETCTVVCASLETDIWFGSSGSLLPSFKAKLISLEGIEITGYDQPGELVLQSPSVVLGYLNNEKANVETFITDPEGQGKWIRTGDEAVVRKAPSGNEHIIIVDRIKELIKVKVSLRAPTSIQLTHNQKGPSGSSGRAGSPSPHPSVGCRLCCHSSSRRCSRGSSKGICCQI
jgi:acyl-CoA synthetase (AMP-forming)/AMP-acid ligase II